MKSVWESYQIFFGSALLSFGISVVFALISKFFWKNQVRLLPSKRFPIAKKRMPLELFLATNAALALIGLSLTLLACVLVLGSGRRQGVFLVVSLAGFGLLGLLYSVKKGCLKKKPRLPAC